MGIACSVFGLLFVMFVAGMAALLIYSISANKKRIEEIGQWAIARGFSFSAVAREAHQQFIETLAAVGHSRHGRSRNLIIGNFHDISWRIFEYRYTTGTGDDETTHVHTIVAGTNSMQTTGLLVRHKTLFAKIKDWLGLGNPAASADEFYRRYDVQFQDSRFAQQVLTPGMMSFFLGGDIPNLHILSGWSVIVFNQLRTPSSIEQAMQKFEQVHSLIPAATRQEYRISA